MNERISQISKALGAEFQEPTGQEPVAYPGSWQLTIAVCPAIGVRVVKNPFSDEWDTRYFFLAPLETVTREWMRTQPSLAEIGVRLHDPRALGLQLIVEELDQRGLFFDNEEWGNERETLLHDIEIGHTDNIAAYLAGVVDRSDGAADDLLDALPWSSATEFAAAVVSREEIDGGEQYAADIVR